MSTENYLKKELYELIKSDERIFDFIQMSSLDGLWYWDLESPENEWMNARFWTTLGYDADSMPHLSSAWQNIINQEDLKLAIENVKMHLEDSNYPYDQVVRYKHKNGSTVWIRCRGIAIRNENGQATRMLGAHHDITALKNSEIELFKAKVRSEENENNLLTINEEYKSINEELNQINSEITAAKQKAEDSEFKYRQLVQNLHAGVVVHAADTSILFANEHASQLLGLSIDQLMGKTAIDPAWHFIQEDLSPLPLDQYPVNYVITHKKPLLELVIGRYLPGTNELIWAMVNAFPEFDSNGVLKQVVATFIDITELKKSEAKLKESEAKYKALIESSNDVIFCVDKNGYYKFVNHIFASTLGHSPEYFEGKSFWDIYPKEHADQRFEASSKVFATGESGSVEVVVPLPDRTLYYIAKTNPIKDEAGNVILNLTHAIDITERKQAEEALKQYADLLAQSQNIAHIGNWVLDFKTKQLKWSDETYRIFGIEPQEFEATYEAFLEFIYPDDRTAVDSAYSLSISEGKESFEIEHRIVRKHSGEIRYVYEKCIHESTANGKLVRSIGIVQDITERKQADEALTQSETKFKEMAELLPQIVFESDMSGNLTYVNKQGYKLTGYTKQDALIGRSTLSFYIPEDRERAIENIKLSLTGKKNAASNEYTMLRKDGSSFIVLVYSSPILKENKPVGLRGIIVDISDRKLAEETLRESEERFKALHNASFGGIAIHDNGIILECNQGLADMTGYSVEELIGMNGLLLIAEKSRETVRNYILSGYENPYEEFGLRKNGEEYPMRLEGKNVPYKGKIVRTTEFRDITETKLAEEKLVESETLKRKMVANIGDVIVIIDHEGINRYKSPNIERLFGWQPEELIGKNTLDNIHPDDLEGAKQFLAILTSKPGEVGIREFRYRHKNGSYSWIEFKGSNLLDDPIIKGILGNYHDISERKKTEQELIASKEKAEESGRLKTAFLQNMSHEIRTPMNAIMGFSELLPQNFENKEKLLKFSKIISQRSFDLLAIINDILDISKIESGLVTVSAEDCQLSVLFSEIKLFFTEQQVQLNKQSIAFDMVARGKFSSDIFITDKVKLKQIFINLLSNAFKFTQSGKIEGGYLVDENQQLVFFVSDTGIGIPSDKLEYIFDRFAQLEKSDSRIYGGTGLGLSIVKGLVQILGGKIWVESELEKGTTFYFTLKNQLNEKQELY